MSELPERKVGIIACSGEELPEGTVSRLATLKVLHELRRGQTVTLCLPLFLAGGEGERAFARVNPTITVDGCELRCAAHGTERYSAKPTASLVVSELLAQEKLAAPTGRRQLDEAGKVAVEVTARKLAGMVDELLAGSAVPAKGLRQASTPQESPKPGACSCACSVPVQELTIGGQPVKVLALPLIFQYLQRSGQPATEPVLPELMKMVKIYNPVPAEAEASWQQTMLREYAEYCRREEAR